MLTEGLVSAVDTVVNKYADETQLIKTTSIEANLELFYKKLEEQGFDLDELKPILECDKDMLVLAGAGAGKTTGLILKIIRDFISGAAMKTVPVPDAFGNTTLVLKPMNILVGTFLKSGAEELKNSFIYWCKTLGLSNISYNSVHFVTLHKEFIDAIKYFGATVKICEDSRVSDIVKGIMHKWNIHQQGGWSKVITLEEINDIKGLFTYCRNRLDESKYTHPLLREYNIDSAILEKMLEEFNMQLNSWGELDFEATQEILYKYMQINPKIKEALKQRYDMVCVDEFQDTSQLQYEILKAYFDGAKRKIVIGDDDQTIYSWRGSDINIITTRFEADYSPQVMPLTSNHRCPDNILVPVIPSIMENKNRHPKRLRSSKQGGIVDVIYNGNPDFLVESINNDLKKYDTIGIISRTNNDLLIPAMLLELGGTVDFQTSKSVTMQSRMPKNICGSIDLVTKRYNDSFEAILKSIFQRNVYGEITMLCNMLSMNPDVTLFNVPHSDLEASVPSLCPFINGLRLAKGENDLTAFVYILEYMIRNTYARDTNYCIKARSFAEFIRDLVTKSKVTENMDIYAIDRLLNAELPARIAKRNRIIQNPRIKLTTVHDAKGKEWDSVYIWNDIDGTFPSAMTRELESEEYEEERRLHYIAWTRAKKHLTVCTSTKNPSPFLLECTIPNVALKKYDDTIIDSKVINPKDDMKNRVEQFIVECSKKPDGYRPLTYENIGVLLGFFDLKSLIDKITDEIFADKSLKTSDDECIHTVINNVATEYVGLLEMTE